MRTLQILTGLLLLSSTAFLSGCPAPAVTSDDGSVVVSDMAKPKKLVDMAVLSSCGHPGDVGNSFGVGKFCMSIADCTGPGMKTTICSSLGNGVDPSADDSYFCTFYPCHPGMEATECGENATCVCGSAGGQSSCACTPNRCVGPAPDMAGTGILDMTNPG